MEKNTLDHRLDAVNRRIGARLRQRRKDYKITMQALGAAIGVSQHQVHKYETGRDRISAARLHLAAHELQVPLGYFFEEGCQ